MKPSDVDIYFEIFTHCRRALGDHAWGRVLAALDEDAAPQQFPQKIDTLRAGTDMPGFVGDLAQIEWALYRARRQDVQIPLTVETLTVNPTLILVEVSWKNLPISLGPEKPSDSPPPEPGKGYVLIWRHPRGEDIKVSEVTDTDLLALKLAAEQIDPRVAAIEGGVSVGVIQSALDRAVAKGFLIPPRSRIRRDFPSDLVNAQAFEPYVTPETFTLQWHITQRCDLHCKHCYDRSDRRSMPFNSALAILDDFYNFCRDKNVKGQVSFSGGNPLLYPRFNDLYHAAWERGFGAAILGNPTPADQMRALTTIARPLFFQISLEGLETHNDDIRGQGHFKRSLAFLETLKRLDIYAMVMLTLTQDNLDQVLPLADLLRERADYFTFNRLATVGEGARLAMVSEDRFEDFLAAYDRAAQQNPIMGLKDNLLNIVRHTRGAEPFGGCTGFGCGAAFNFVALLADGEVHACRKFPSLIGNIYQDRLIGIYDSQLARQYRSGGAACRGCRLWPVCRGCPAVTFSNGLDPFAEKDPFCFLRQEEMAETDEVRPAGRTNGI